YFGDEPVEVNADVKLLDHTPDPVRTIYTAFRTCYSALSPQKIWSRIDDGRITREEMLDFIAKWLKTGHTSPRTHVWYTFAASGVSRALCYAEDTEVLTAAGWKNFADLTDDDLYCTLNPATHAIEYHPAGRRYAYAYRGELYYVRSSKVDLQVTP